MSRRGSYRLAEHPVNQGRPIGFSFNGQRMRGQQGDSLAAALLANGVRAVSRSFKFRRPRGVFTAGIEEPNALVQLYRGAHAIPSVSATLTPLEDGLEAFSQSGWPSVRMDVLRLLDLAAPLWASGFYNKTFMWPRWEIYEKIIRRFAGLGRAPHANDPDRYDVRNAHCDVLVIGGGVAGLSAASAASRAGARVIVADRDVALGGYLWGDDSKIEGLAATRWVSETVERLSRRENVHLLPRTTAVGCYDHNVVTLSESVPYRTDRAAQPRERFWIIRSQRIILATGAIEQPLIFCNNDRPGIFLASAVHQYLRRFGVAAGRRVVVATNNDSAYAVARDLCEAGVGVTAIADTRRDVSGALIADMRSLSIPVRTATIPVDTRGWSGIRSVTLGSLTADENAVSATETIPCDALAVSGGFNPALQLYSQAGGKLIYQEKSRTLEPANAHPSIRIVGAAAGTTSLDVAVRLAADHGKLAASEVTSRTPGPSGMSDATAALVDGIGPRVSPVGPAIRQWVDLRHDVTVADLELAVRENYVSIEHVKRYTTCGMSVDQGKTSNVAAMEIVARLRRLKPMELGYTTMRPPFVPVTLGAIVGREQGPRFAPERLLPMHAWHVANGALLENFGEWKRPAVYPRPSESWPEAVAREARTVRSAAGIFDGSPLGKIEVHGPDALEFLEHFYINRLADLRPGRVRYGIMLRESGVLFDDGTAVMRKPNHFIITTTSGNAGRVAAWLEEWRQCEWPKLRVVIMPVTDQWATLSLAGPRARAILSKLATDIDLSAEAFPHLAMREGNLLGYATRIYRVSFTGELTFEINVPSGCGQAVWEAIMTAGTPLGIEPLGVEALLLLRLEKGFLHIGTDTDGTTVPDDVGWGKVAAAKSDFIGKRSLRLPDNVRPDRLQLVGLVGLNGVAIPIGSHLRLQDSAEASDGWVTSAGTAVCSGQPIALALLRAGRRNTGAVVSVHDAGRVTQGRIVEPLFFDPTGSRMRA